jgi:hypothetical protein
MRTRLDLAIATTAGLAFSVPAFSAQTRTSAYDVCLLRAAHAGGYYTSLDNGDSAIVLMHACDADRADWVVRCVAGNPDRYSDCYLKSGMRALLAVVAIEDARAFGRPETGGQP